MNKQAIVKQLQSGIVFSGIIKANKEQAPVTIWRSKCRHYKIKVGNGPVLRYSLDSTLALIKIWNVKPILTNIKRDWLRVAKAALDAYNTVKAYRESLACVHPSRKPIFELAMKHHYNQWQAFSNKEKELRGVM